jgi:hypothetical protein
MSSPKKPKPSFDIPADVESVADSGWVYRSEKEPEEAPPVLRLSEPGAVMSLAFAVMAQALTLGSMVATIPFALTLRTLQVFDQSDH